MNTRAGATWTSNVVALGRMLTVDLIGRYDDMIRLSLDSLLSKVSTK
jgi:hypothetical protein